jgi:hypothetical protein
MDFKTVSSPWYGWGWYDQLYLLDPQGNRYSPEMVRSSIYTAELAHQLTGSPLQIASMKAQLLRRLSTPSPEIVIRWDGQETVIKPPKWKLNC